MNAAATQDVRAIDTVPLLQRLLKGPAAPSTRRRRRCSTLLVAWRAARRQPAGQEPGRQDRRPRGGDHGRRLAEDRRRVHEATARFAARRAELAVLSLRPASGRPVRRLVPVLRPRHPARCSGEPVAQPFQNSYCGHGDQGRCQQAIWNAIAAAGAQLTADQGTSNPAAWRADATAERIHFAPGCCRRRCATRTGRAGSSR